MRIVRNVLVLLLLAGCGIDGWAQKTTADSVLQRLRVTNFSLGGYGEVAYSRNFYSDNQYRYRNPSFYKDDPDNGRFDIPHFVLFVGYNFGNGWTLGSEIEFEHTGNGVALEIESDEGGEYEKEVERGGEVELEQFWINKRFANWANLKMGHIIVPVGLNNAHHEPLNFFTVYRPEGENTILPSTWHDTGISFWGGYSDFRYELMIVAGLNALQFSRDGWIHNGCNSAFEFKPANKYGFAFRLDNYTIPGLRMGLSGFYGQGMHNNYPNEMEGAGKVYNNVKANTMVGSFDFTFKRWNWIVRGQADYGYVSDTPMLNIAKANTQKNSNADVTKVGKNALAIGVEAGYDVFSLSEKLKEKNKLYLFARFDYYDSYIPEVSQTQYGYTKKKCWTLGVNYFPNSKIAIKADYNKRILSSQYNNEPSINLGVAFEGIFM